MTDSEAAARAAALLELGRADEALQMVAPFVATSQDPTAHAVAVVALMDLGRPVDAARAADAAMEACGPVPELARVASYAYRDAGAPVKGVAVARAGVEQAPEWVPGLLALIEAELAVGHRAEAQAGLSTALALAPDSPSLRLVAADVALASGDRKLAREHCLEALHLDPTNASALRGLGLLDEQRNRIARAASWYAMALRLRPGDEELATRVRALFGRLLGTINVGILVVMFAAFFTTMSRVDRSLDQRNSTGLTDGVTLVLAFLACGAFLGWLYWTNFRGVPRVVLDALRSETRTFRRVQRCARLTAAYAGSVALLTLTALIPAGGDTRLGIVFFLFLIAMVLMVVSLISLRVTFGYGQTRAAEPHPRDQSFAR